MRTHRSVLLLGAIAVASVSEAGPPRDCSRNAALGYWMAMAEMQNPDLPAALAEQLERTARGDAPWDERLAATVDANRDALATMHRASELPFCDWGLEYSRSAEAPIAHLVRARVLARLNVLYGLHLLHQGRASEAAAAWASGLRFSQDIAAGAPLVGALYAAEQMQAHMKAVEGARARLPAEKLREVERLVSSQPEDGFDWGSAIDVELGGALGQQERLAASEDPCGQLRRFLSAGASRAEQDRAVAAYLGLPADRLADRQAVRQALRQSITAIQALRSPMVAAFRLPYGRSVPAVRDVVAKAGADPTLAQGWRSLVRANEDARASLVAAHGRLLAELRGRPAAAITAGQRRLRDVPSPDVPLATILDRAAEYVRHYSGTFTNVVAEETCQQWLRAEWATTSAEMGIYGSPRAAQRTEARTLRADVVWVAVPGTARWGMFRDVLEVDGRKIADHEGRLVRLFADRAPAAVERARRILAESSGRFLGPRRDVNLPTNALLWLLPENQRRLELERKGERTIADLRGVEVEFREVARPTLVRDRGADVTSSGRFWIEPATGAVLRSEIEYKGRGLVTTEYRHEEGFTVLVPDVMKELGYNVDADGAGKFETSARYAAYRHFDAAAGASSTGKTPPRD